MKNTQQGGIFFRLLFLLMLVLLIGLIYLVRYPILRFAGGWWEAGDQPQPADAIIVLGDDNFAGDRAAEAAGMFHEGMAPLVVASGRLLRSYAGIAELIARDLETRGVPSSAIVQFPQRAANTREEALALRDLAKSRGWGRVLVVTSNYHTRRARYIFRKVFPPQVAVLVVAARDSDYDPNRWWQTRQGRKIFFLESVGYLTAVWESWDGGGSSADGAPRPVASPQPAAQ
jgi:uncharacterized SAM-binding protein YcdF (DUF218 family)